MVWKMAEQQQQQHHRCGHIDPTAVSSICENLMRVVEQLHSTMPSRHEGSHFRNRPGPSSSRGRPSSSSGPSSSGHSSNGQSHLAWVASSHTPPAPQPRRSFPSGSAIAGQLFKSGQSSSAIFDRKGKRRRIDPREKWSHNFYCLPGSSMCLIFLKRGGYRWEAWVKECRVASPVWPLWSIVQLFWETLGCRGLRVITSRTKPLPGTCSYST